MALNWRNNALYFLAILWLLQLVYNANFYDFSIYHSQLYERCMQAAEPYSNENVREFSYGKPALLLLKTAAQTFGVFNQNKTGFYGLSNGFSVLFAILSTILLIFIFLRFSQLNHMWWLFLLLNLWPTLPSLLAFHFEASFVLFMFLAALWSLVYYFKKNHVIFIVLWVFATMLLSAQVAWGIFTLFVPLIYWAFHPKTKTILLLLPAAVVTWMLQWVYFPELIHNLPGRQVDFVTEPFKAFAGEIMYNGNMHYGNGLPATYVFVKWLRSVPLFIFLLFPIAVLVLMNKPVKGKKSMWLLVILMAFLMLIISMANGAYSAGQVNLIPIFILLSLFCAVLLGWMVEFLPNLRGAVLYIILPLLLLALPALKAQVFLDVDRYNYQNLAAQTLTENYLEQESDYEEIQSLHYLRDYLKETDSKVANNMTHFYPGFDSMVFYQNYWSFSNWDKAVFSSFSILKSEKAQKVLFKNKIIESINYEGYPALVLSEADQEMHQKIRSLVRADRSFLATELQKSQRQFFEEVLSANQHFNAHFALSYVWQLAGNADSTLYHINACIKQAKRHEVAWFAKAKFLRLLGRHQKARESLDHLQNFSKENDLILLERAYISEDEGKWKQAYELADKAQNMDGAAKPTALFLKKYLEEQMRVGENLVDQHRSFFEALKKDSVQISTYQYKDLLDDVESYSERRPELEAWRLLLLDMYLYQENTGMALRMAEEAVLANPFNKEARKLLRKMKAN